MYFWRFQSGSDLLSAVFQSLPHFPDIKTRAKCWACPPQLDPQLRGVTTPRPPCLACITSQQFAQSELSIRPYDTVKSAAPFALLIGAKCPRRRSTFLTVRSIPPAAQVREIAPGPDSLYNSV